MTKLTETLIIQNAHAILSDEKHYHRKGEYLVWEVRPGFYVIKKGETYTFTSSSSEPSKTDHQGDGSGAQIKLNVNQI